MQYARLPMSAHLTKHYKTSLPALNIHQRQEYIVTDTVYSDIPAVCGGDT